MIPLGFSPTSSLSPETMPDWRSARPAGTRIPRLRACTLGGGGLATTPRLPVTAALDRLRPRKRAFHTSAALDPDAAVTSTAGWWIAGGGMGNDRRSRLGRDGVKGCPARRRPVGKQRLMAPPIAVVPPAVAGTLGGASVVQPRGPGRLQTVRICGTAAAHPVLSIAPAHPRDAKQRLPHLARLLYDAEDRWCYRRLILPCRRRLAMWSPTWWSTRGQGERRFRPG